MTVDPSDLTAGHRGHAPARDDWETAVPGDARVDAGQATLPDQVGEDYTLEESAGAAPAPRTDDEPPLVQEGESYALREVTE